MSFERCNDCTLLHEECSDKIIDLSSDSNSFSSIEDDQVKEQPSRCPRCRLLHSFVCVSFDGSDSEVSDLFGPHEYLDESIEWNTFLVQAHSTKKLDWICNWDQSHKVHHEFSHVPRQQPATLVSCALQVLDEAGHLDFNIQDPFSLEVALTRIGAIDQIPVEELSMVHNRQPKKVTFYLPGADASVHKSNVSCNKEEFYLKDILEHALTSLTPMQTFAVDLLFDANPLDWLNNSLLLNF